MAATLTALSRTVRHRIGHEEDKTRLTDDHINTEIERLLGVLWVAHNVGHDDLASQSRSANGDSYTLKAAHPGILQLLDDVRRRRADSADKQRRPFLDGHVDHLVEPAKTVVDVGLFRTVASLHDENVDARGSLGVIQIRFEFLDALADEFGSYGVSTSDCPARMSSAYVL